MTDETILDPDEPIEENLAEDDGPDETADDDDAEEAEPVEGDVTEQDVEDEPPVKTAEIPADAW